MLFYFNVHITSMAVKFVHRLVFVFLEIGVSPDATEADDSLIQQFIYSESEVDGLWTQTQVTEGSSLSALNKGIWVHASFRQNRISIGFFFFLGHRKLPLHLHMTHLTSSTFVFETHDRTPCILARSSRVAHRGRACVSFCIAELASVKATLRELVCLSPETRFSLLNLFEEILPDQTLLSTLEDKLENICDESIHDSLTFMSDTSNELTDKFLDVLQAEIDSMDRLPKEPNGSSPAMFYQNGGQSSPVKGKAGKSNQ